MVNTVYQEPYAKYKINLFAFAHVRHHRKYNSASNSLLEKSKHHAFFAELADVSTGGRFYFFIFRFHKMLSFRRNPANSVQIRPFNDFFGISKGVSVLSCLSLHLLKKIFSSAFSSDLEGVICSELSGCVSHHYTTHSNEKYPL